MSFQSVPDIRPGDHKILFNMCSSPADQGEYRQGIPFFETGFRIGPFAVDQDGMFTVFWDMQLL